MFILPSAQRVPGRIIPCIEGMHRFCTKENLQEMVRIRLRRVGSKHQPSYRIVVADKRSPRDGRFIEKIGFYNPRTQPATMQIDEARALHWLSNGADPSEAVARILTALGTMERYERLKKGDATLEELLNEVGALETPEIDPRTRRDDLKSAPKKSEPVAEEVAAAEAEVDAEADAEVEVEVEAEAEVDAEADAEVEVEAEAEVDAEADAEVEVEAEAEVDAEADAEAEAEGEEE